MHHSPSALPPTEQQLQAMDTAKAAATVYAQAVGALLRDGPRKKLILHKLRTMELIIADGIAHQED